jgi:hypothetical protein
MLTRCCAVVLVSVLAFASLAIAAEVEGVVVKYEADSMKLTLKSGEKEKVWQLDKRTHVHYPESGKIKEIRLKERADYLKKGVRVTLEEEEGRVVEVNIVLKK